MGEKKREKCEVIHPGSLTTFYRVVGLIRRSYFDNWVGNNNNTFMPPYDKNEYSLADFDDSARPPQVVSFYEKNEDGTELPGTTLEAMLRVSIIRLKDLNGRFSCRENSLAITKMEEALMWLNARTADRIARGVEGKHEL